MGGKASLAKVRANRRNAQLSTGPKTVSGKGVVKWNAMRHGLLSKEVVIRAGDGKESASEFQNLLRALRNDLQPEGVLEEMLVEKIAVCYWRLRRVVRCETGEIRGSLDTHIFDALIRRAETVCNAVQSSSCVEGCEKQLLMSTAGIQRLLGIVGELRQHIKRLGEIPESARNEVMRVFGGKENQFGHDLLFFTWLATDEGQKATREDCENDEEPPSPDRCRKVILKLLADKERFLKDALEVIQERQDLRTESEMAGLSLPDAGAADRILRYEAAIERQMYRAMDQLERLQRQRRGEFTPPPVNLQLLTLE